MYMFSLSSAILLVRVRTGHTVMDATATKVGIKALIFTSPITLKIDNFVR